MAKRKKDRQYNGQKKKDRQYNGRKKKDNKTKNDLQNELLLLILTEIIEHKADHNI